VQPIEHLDLGLLVHAEHPQSTPAAQVPANDAPDLAAKVGVRAVQPSLNPMRLERGVLQPSSHRALADGRPNVAPRRRRLGEGTQGPVRPGAGQLAQWLAREDDDLMPLFGGKTSGADPSVARPAAPATGRAQTESASAGPICDRVPPAGQCRTRSHHPSRATRPGHAWPATDRSGPRARARSACFARAVRVSSAAPTVAWSSWPAGYLTAELPWGRTFGTRY
jgi:hypothetical protein